MLRAAYTRYILQFKTPSGTSRGILHDKETWFNKIKSLCDELGYASDMKAYKLNPENYKGNVADVSTVLRVCLTTKSMTPDLYDIMKILGKERMKKRYNYFIER